MHSKSVTHVCEHVLPISPVYTLATARVTPAHLAHAAGTRNNVTGFGIGRDVGGEGTTFLLGPVVGG